LDLIPWDIIGMILIVAGFTAIGFTLLHDV
jgi:hypothetical protein